MTLVFLRPASRHKRGFTLTEMAIVLGVFCVILAGIWSAASSARQSARVRQSFDGIASIVDNLRAIYAGQVSINGTYDTLVPLLIQQGVIPANLISGLSSSCNGSTSSHFAITPWGGITLTSSGHGCGSLYVCSWNNGDNFCGSTAAASAQNFGIQFNSLDIPSCIALTTGMNSYQIPGLKGIYVNDSAASTTTFPVPVATAIAKCTDTSSGNYVDFVYGLRPPST